MNLLKGSNMSIIPRNFNASSEITISSMEIAKETGKDHFNVLRDIRNMLGQLHDKEGVIKFEYTRINEQNGMKYKYFELPYEECMILLAGYSIPLRAAVIKRWKALEEEKLGKQPTYDIPQSFSQALMLAAKSQEELEKAQAKIEADRPKVEFVDTFVTSDGLSTLRDMAKLLKAKEKELTAFLIDKKILFRGKETENKTGRLQAYKQALDKGLVEIKIISTKTKNPQTQKEYTQEITQVFFTAKGISFISEAWKSTRSVAQECVPFQLS